MLLLEDSDHAALREHHRLALDEGRALWVSFAETADPTAPRVTFVLALRIHESEAAARASAQGEDDWAGVEAHGRVSRVWGRVRDDGGIEARGVVTRDAQGDLRA